MRPLKFMTIRKHEKMDYSSTNYRTFFSIVEVLGKRIPIEDLWMVHNGGSKLKEYNDNVTAYNVFAFSDFVEIMEILKPDLVISMGGDFEYLERSMLKAAKAKGILTVDIVSSVYELSYLEKGSSDSIITGRLYALVNRGGYILRKYFFLLKTLYRAKYGVKYIFTTVLKDMYLPLSAFVPRYNFGAGNLNIVPTPTWINILTKKGIEKETIVVTGECSMDKIYDDLRVYKESHRNDRIRDRLKIVFITTNMVEHGYWKPKMRDELVRNVFKGLKEEFGPSIELKVKIHPVNESEQTYKNLISDIDSKIPVIQKADLLELIGESHVVIGFGITSAYLQAILLRKPVILLNFYNENVSNNIYIRENIVTECTSIDELINLLKRKSYKVIDDDRLDDLIQKIFYKFDGKCTQRASKAIFDLLLQSGKISSEYS